MSGGRFAGRVCLVTGSTGMGASAARALAAEGANVFIASRTADHARALAAEIGDAAAWEAADLGREDGVEAVAGACIDAFGRLDAVFNVAGISGRRFGDGPIDAATLEGWEAVLTANATSHFLVCRAVIGHWLGQPADAAGMRGAIVNMSSQLARRPSPAYFATHAYAASKGAIEALTLSLAAHYAPHGIRVNAIAPGLIATPMSERAQGDARILAYLGRKQPLAGGVIGVDEVTPTVLHLLSDDARMVTGQIIGVDAGWSVSEPPG